ncbi:MAG: hypothetical protein Q9219_001169 [cf. Caloplaca sp. 3 TL-2023]
MNTSKTAGLTVPWAPVDYPIAVQVLKTALEQGANLWNGVSAASINVKQRLSKIFMLTLMKGMFYGTAEANSLQLLKYYFEKYPEDASKVVLSIKGAFDLKTGPNGTPEGIRASVEEAVRALGGCKTIDVFECARADPNVPIETSVKALAELAKEGKIAGIGLSEVSANTIRKAHDIYPVSAVEIELSLFTPDPLQNGVTEHQLRTVGIPVIAYSPISRGWLTGGLRKLEDLPQNDFRRTMPRFQPEVFDQNLKLVEAVEHIAKRKGVTTAQVAIGWVCRQGAIPIPGSTKSERVIENCRPVPLTDEDVAEIQDIMATLPISGERYGGAQEKFLNA